MRKIPVLPILVSSLFQIFALGVVALFGWTVHQILPAGEYRASAVVIMSVPFLVFAHLTVFRLLVTLFPVWEGQVVPSSQLEFNYNVVTVYALVWIYPLIYSHLVPVPLTPLLYRLLGARLGKNTYTAGAILDAWFVSIGDNCILGLESVIIPHVHQTQTLAHQRIVIGDNVTIGARAMIMAGVQIGDGAIIGMNSVVTQGTIIGPHEVWAGSPARLIKRTQAPAASPATAVSGLDRNSEVTRF